MLGEAGRGAAERGGAGRCAERNRSGGATGAAACSQSRNNLLETIPEQSIIPRNVIPIQE